MKISYDYFCNITASLTKFLLENPRVMSRPMYIQTKLHLASNNCPDIYDLVNDYRYGCCSIHTIVLAIIVAKFWKSDTLFENAMGDVATYYYMVNKLDETNLTAKDFHSKVLALQNYMFDI